MGFADKFAIALAQHASGATRGGAAWHHAIRWADVIDVLIVAVLLYVAFSWFRTRASRSLGVVLLLLGGVFSLARSLDLYLTMMAFQYGAIALVLALVVVFQQDIRHGFERLTSFALWDRPAGRSRTQEVVDVILEAVAHMSRERTGALIVFPGKEPLDRHLRGGVTVDAEISLPLLLSIFHSASPGHDGAILVEGRRIRSLGLHLPLTRNVERLGLGGTRHAAALGLADCCDALVLVVSEERGTVSLAQHGSLDAVDPETLAERLGGFCECGGEPQTARNPAQRRLRSLGTQLAALAVAMLLWFGFAYHTDTVQRTFVVPIEYRNLAEGWQIEEPNPTHAEVTISGSETAFSLLDASGIAVSLEFDSPPQKRIYSWATEPNLTGVESELQIERVSPASVTVAIDQEPPPAQAPATP